jgi:hypothetical protein
VAAIQIPTNQQHSTTCTWTVIGPHCPPASVRDCLCGCGQPGQPRAPFQSYPISCSHTPAISMTAAGMLCMPPVVISPLPPQGLHFTGTPLARRLACKPSIRQRHNLIRANFSLCKDSATMKVLKGHGMLHQLHVPQAPACAASAGHSQQAHQKALHHGTPMPSDKCHACKKRTGSCRQLPNAIIMATLP